MSHHEFIKLPVAIRMILTNHDVIQHKIITKCH